MAGGAGRIVTWPLGAAWAAAVEVTAAVFGIEPDLLRAPSRGRGPRPPERAREPKKVAIYLAVVLTDADYAVLARYVGLHKDTVSSHCADVREWCMDDWAERLLEALVVTAALKLELACPCGAAAAHLRFAKGTKAAIGEGPAAPLRLPHGHFAKREALGGLDRTDVIVRFPKGSAAA